MTNNERNDAAKVSKIAKPFIPSLQFIENISTKICFHCYSSMPYG